MSRVSVGTWLGVADTHSVIYEMGYEHMDPLKCITHACNNSIFLKTLLRTPFPLNVEVDKHSYLSTHFTGREN